MNCVNISRFGMCKSADIFCLFLENNRIKRRIKRIRAFSLTVREFGFEWHRMTQGRKNGFGRIAAKDALPNHYPTPNAHLTLTVSISAFCVGLHSAFTTPVN